PFLPPSPFLPISKTPLPSRSLSYILNPAQPSPPSSPSSLPPSLPPSPLPPSLPPVQLGFPGPSVWHARPSPPPLPPLPLRLPFPPPTGPTPSAATWEGGSSAFLLHCPARNARHARQQGEGG
ncbi:hypothetical protein Naga_103880g1, partial [Nannochloropsis gaditana]